MSNTKSMRRFLFIWWWNRAGEIYEYWRDGLKVALEIIGNYHDVEFSLGEVFPEEKNWDAVLVWGDSNCPFLNRIGEYDGRKGIILTTSPHNVENLKKLDVVFCESTPVYEEVRKHGLHAIKAFGTDEVFYCPKDIKKDLEYFYPATFSPWKRQRDIAYLGKDLWCVGTVQPDGEEDLKACEGKGVNIAKGYFKAEYIRDLYQRAKKVIIPAVHGSERTVLESMASGIVPEVTNSLNIRAKSYIKEYLESGFTDPRQFIIENYNVLQYAEKIVKGLLGVNKLF